MRRANRAGTALCHERENNMKRLLALILLCFVLTSCGTVKGNDSKIMSNVNESSVISAVSTFDNQVGSMTSVNESSTVTNSKQSASTNKKPANTSSTSSASKGQYDRYETVNFSDYDTGDAAYSLNLAIEAVNMKGSVASVKGEKVHYTLKMPKKQYKLDTTISLVGVQNLTIDGSGSTFVYTKNVSGIFMNNCKNITLTNITFDYDPLRYTQGEIKAINGTKITVEIDKGYPSDVNFINGASNTHDDVYNAGDNVFSANLYDAKTGVIKENSPGNYLIKTDAVSKGGRLIEVTVHSNSTWEGGPTFGMEVGDLIAFSYVGDKLIWAENCQGGLQYINLTVWGTSGCGFWETGGGVGGSLFKNVVVEPGPKPTGATRNRLVSVNGDFLHQNGLDKGPIVDGCKFVGMMDDVINIHGLVYYVLSSSGNKTLIAPRWAIPFVEGEQLIGYDSETLAAVSGKVKVKSMKSYNDSSKKSQIEALYRYCDKQWGDTTLVYEITTDKPLNVKYGDYIVSEDHRGSGTVIKNSTFGKNRSRGIVVKSDDVLIENNTIESTGFPSITLQFDNAFGESGFTSNAIIRNNKIINGTTCVDMTMKVNEYNYGAIMIGMQFDQVHQGYLNNYEHKNIAIENNTIQGTSVYGIFCTSVDGLTVRNNTIINPFKHGIGKIGEAYNVTPNGGILIGQCKNVTVTGNKVTGGPSQITQAVQLDKNVSGLKANSNNKKQ